MDHTEQWEHQVWSDLSKRDEAVMKKKKHFMTFALRMSHGVDIIPGHKQPK
jgi:hypothetical protein